MDDPAFTEAIWHSDLAFLRNYLQQRRLSRTVDELDNDEKNDNGGESLGRGPDGDSPLHLCVQANAQPEVFGLLLRSGACCPAVRRRDGCLAEDLFSESKFGPLYREELDCFTADIIAAGRTHRLEVWLLRGWTVPDRGEEAFRTVVAEGAISEAQMAEAFDKLELLQAAIDSLHRPGGQRPLACPVGEEPPADPRLLESLDQFGLGLLHKAALGGDVVIARRLLAVRPDLAASPDFLGRPAAFYCQEDDKEMLQLLGGGPGCNSLGDYDGASAEQMLARLVAGGSDCARHRPRLDEKGAHEKESRPPL